MTMPTFYIPHGGGPCFFMEWNIGPRDTWDGLEKWLRRLKRKLPEEPSAILVISAHWEEKQATVTTTESPSLIYDYYGFPKHTYKLKWPAPGDPVLAARVRMLLEEAGIPSAENDKRGFDHGVFVPFKVSFPDADIPTVQLSLVKGLDPLQHIEIGRALAPLRDEGVLIIGSGMSYHNMKKFMTPAARPHSKTFNSWIEDAVALDQYSREDRLCTWERAPCARKSHPSGEHLLPLMVAAGAAADDWGQSVFQDEVLGAQVCAVQFG
jgi:aromatic ring-opening dioxygenase catalytic subunit (LigB family)